MLGLGITTPTSEVTATGYFGNKGKMMVYKVGEKSTAICYGCKVLVTTTFEHRDVPFDDGIGVARGVLASVCDKCGSVVALPAQSTPEIVAARKTAQAENSDKGIG